ncbi:MAG: ATP-binding cassette domain-containing protein [Pseudomonadales bacterium]|nr:ATP-binding cassette domain-containing protein [Pseudomonadales bacterium]
MQNEAQVSLPENSIVEISALHKSFQDLQALCDVTATIDAGKLTGLVGPDGAGKTTLLRCLAGLLSPTSGSIRILQQDPVTDSSELVEQIGYMPQRFGLYEDLSVIENLRLYAQLRQIETTQRDQIFEQLLEFTKLAPFQQRRAGKLSGGMKQKLGLACALMSRPKLLLLDEPGVGVDPVSRQDLWQMVDVLTEEGMAVVWATAYLDEAEQCETVLLMNEGSLAFAGSPTELTDRLHGRSFRISGIQNHPRELLKEALQLPGVIDGVIQGRAVRTVTDATEVRTDLQNLAASVGGQLESVAPRFEDAFVDLLGGGPGGQSALAEQMETVSLGEQNVVECRNLTKRFGSFAATDNVSFTVNQGEIFGLLGPNGAGKSTTFKMLCGLLKPTEGTARVAGLDLSRSTTEAKLKLGYMAQKFSLYGLLSVEQNLDFFAGVYGLTGATKKSRIEEMVETFQLQAYLTSSPDNLPLGFKQRLALACATMHRPPVLFLDEPTSGVDPITRREFWTHINGLVGKGVTVMVTTHFMDEAEYCDRIALMYNAKLIALDSTDNIKASMAGPQEDLTMEQAFIRLIKQSDLQREAA